MLVDATNSDTNKTQKKPTSWRWSLVATRTNFFPLKWPKKKRREKRSLGNHLLMACHFPTKHTSMIQGAWKKISCIRGYENDIWWRYIDPTKFWEKSSKIDDISQYIDDLSPIYHMINAL